MIDPGTLNRRVTVERFTLVEGPLNPEEIWADLRMVSAGMRYDSRFQGVNEVFNSDELIAERVVFFTMRFTSDLTAVDRLRCMDVEYDILGIREIGNRDGIEVAAKARNPGGA